MLIYVFSDKILGLNKVWFLGDNFTATTYCKYFLHRSPTYEKECGVKLSNYIKDNYDFDVFCNSRFNSATKNMLTRILNTFTSAVNKSTSASLPQYIIVILDDDIITYLDYKGVSVGELFGLWWAWLIQEVRTIIQKRREQLPKKAQSDHESCVYWCVAPTHANFSIERNEIRKKLNFCLESILKGKQDMRIMKLKEWNGSDNSLVKKDKMSDHGLYMYWNAVEAAFKFNVEKHELFLARATLAKKAATSGNATSSKVASFSLD